MARKEGVLGDEAAQDVRRKRQRLEEEQQVADLSWLMSYPQGRRWLYRLIYGVCEVESGIWEASAAIHYREGRRSVGIQVKNEAQAHAPGLYLTMIQEQLIEAQKRTNQRESTDE